MRWSAVWCVLAVLFLCAAVHAEGLPESWNPPASMPPPPFPLEWVRLVPTETIKAGEKEPATAEIIIREAPSERAKPLGVIRAKIAEKKVELEFQPEGSATAEPFTPDLSLDESKGRIICKGNEGSPWYHQTILRREDDWVQVPPKPWAQAGWVNVKTNGLDIWPLVTGAWGSKECYTPYKFEGRSVLVYGRTSGGLCIGPAGTGSFSYFWTKVPEAPLTDYCDNETLCPVSEIKWENLVDSDGRLRLKLATKPAAKKEIKDLTIPNIGWIGLFDPTWSGILDKVNLIASSQIQKECTLVFDENHKPHNYEEYKKCIENVYKKLDLEKVVELPVHEMPDLLSKRIGTIVVKLRDNVYAEFRKEESDEVVPFEPDEYDGDWGYGIHFHHTYLDKKGSWYKLPAAPLPKPGWIDISPLTTSEPASGGTVMPSFYSGLVVVGIAADASGLCVRTEQAWDYCSPYGIYFTEKDLVLEPVWVIPWKDLFDKNGHLLLHCPYKRGC